MPLEFRLPSWSQTRHSSRAGFERVYAAVDGKLGANHQPHGRVDSAQRLAAETFWPGTLEKENTQAAQILRSFILDSEDPIAPDIFRQAHGVAIFTLLRTGLWIKEAGGSGVLLARNADRSWSSTCAILLHAPESNFSEEVDIYDCLLIINSTQAVESFAYPRCTLGTDELEITVGPRTVPADSACPSIWMYAKSKGVTTSIGMQNMIMSQRQDENARWYGDNISADDILTGKVQNDHAPLLALLNVAQGNSVDQSDLPVKAATPGDYEVKEEQIDGFGLPPSIDDPDPFGVRALEQQGMMVREAGTGSRPSGDVFEYRPSPTSPIYPNFQTRRSSRSHSGRLSIASNHTDRGTQTADFGSPRMIESPKSSIHPIPEDTSSEDGSVRLPRISRPKSVFNERKTRQIDTPDDHIENLDSEPEDEYDEDEEEEEEATIIEHAKAVTIPRRLPPSLPMRSPFRSTSRSGDSNDVSTPGLGIALASPNDDLAGFPISPIKEDVHEPSFPNLLDPSRLSPSHEVCDAASLRSASDYSHTTPPEGLAEEPRIQMEDHEVEDTRQLTAKRILQDTYAFSDEKFELPTPDLESPSAEPSPDDSYNASAEDGDSPGTQSSKAPKAPVSEATSTSSPLEKDLESKRTSIDQKSMRHIFESRQARIEKLEQQELAFFEFSLSDSKEDEPDPADRRLSSPPRNSTDLTIPSRFPS